MQSVRVEEAIPPEWAACASHRGSTMRNMLAVLALVVACTGGSDKSSPPPRPESTLTGTRPRAMRNCPSGVLSSVTTVTPVDDGVELTITSADERARSEIVLRARLQERMFDPWSILPADSGFHGGPGTKGFCPIIHANTIVSAQKTVDGVRIHVQARRPGDIKLLQQATGERVRALLPSS
jgi:hypothetical protein